MKLIKSIIGDRETVTVERSLLVRTAARLMADKNIGAVPVLDDERLAGIFSERDVLTRVVAAGCDPDSTRVGDVMSSELVVADPAESYETCLSRMREAHVRHLIVLDQGRLAGIVSLRDLLAVDIDEKDEAIGILNAYVST
jgi:CBS domain-containing protein